MAKLAGLPDGRYDPACSLAFVGEDCVLASLVATCLHADTSLEKLPDHNSSLPEICSNSAKVVRAAGWTRFTYKVFVGQDDQEWPVVNRRQALVFMATLENFPEEERIRCYKLLCAAMDDNSADADADLTTMRQSVWDLGQLHDVTGGGYLEAQPSYPGSHSHKATSSAAQLHAAACFKAMPETLYNQVQYRARYTCAVEEFIDGLSQDERETAIFSKPDSRADLHKSFSCPKCNRSIARQGALAEHVATQHPELLGVDLTFYTVMYDPQSDRVKIDPTQSCTREVRVKHVPHHGSVARQARPKRRQSAPKKRRNEGCPTVHSKRAATQGRATQQQSPQQAEAAKISELQSQLAEARVAAAEAKVATAVARADGLAQVLAEKSKQEKRYDQAQKVKDEQMNQLININQQQSETANATSKAFAVDQLSVRVRSVEGAQKASNQFHAFKNASHSGEQ